MTNNFNIEETSSFISECKIINLKYEYEGYNGKEKWAIVTDLSEKEVLRKYSMEIAQFQPLLFLTQDQGTVMAAYTRNENKHRMRQLRYGSMYDINDCAFNEHHPEIMADYDILDLIVKKETSCEMMQNIEMLTNIQRKRVIKFFYEGKNICEIAKEEGVNHSKISKSIILSLKKLKNFLEKGSVHPLPVQTSEGVNF